MKSVWKLSIMGIFLSLLLGLMGFASPVSADDGQRNRPLPMRLIVQFEGGTSWSKKALVHQQAGAKIEGVIPRIGVHVVTVPAERGFSSLRAYRLHREVRHVELDSLAQAVDMPNDPYLDEQWGMTKVQAPQAWGLTQGNALSSD